MSEENKNNKPVSKPAKGNATPALEGKLVNLAHEKRAAPIPPKMELQRPKTKE